MARPLNEKQITEAWDAYCRDPSGQAIARATGIHRMTAAKLINKGYDKPHWPPFKKRYEEIAALAKVIADKRAVADTATQLVGLKAQLAELRGINSKMLKRANAALDNDDCEVDPVKALTALTKSIKASVELEAMLALIDSPEDMDEAVENAAEDMSGWDDAELLEYGRTGNWPPGKPRPVGLEADSTVH